jgi:ribosomal protein S21
LRLKNFGLTVEVENGNVEKALRKFKKKVSNDGKIQDVRNRQEYIKPSTKKKLARAAAKKRWQKQVQSTQMPKRLY